MSNDLNAVLGRAIDELASRDDAGELLLAGLRRSVRRRRVQRHTVESVVGLAAVGVVGTAAWAGLRFTTPPPAVEPTPTVQPTPTATSTPTPTGTPSLTPSPTPSTTTTPPVPASFGQPSSVPVTPAVLRSAKVGWVLAVSAPQYLHGEGDVVSAGPPVLFLVSPAGDRYKVLEMAHEYWLVHWAAGQTHAIVQVAKGPYRSLDLLTGELDPVAGITDDDQWVGVDSAGRTIWQNTAGRVLAVAPDGTSTVLAWTLVPLGGPLSPNHDLIGSGYGVFDLKAERKRFFQPPSNGASCSTLGWLSDAEVVIGCSESDGQYRTYSTPFTPDWDPVTSQPHPQPWQLDGIEPGSVRWVEQLTDGRLVVVGTDQEGRSTVVVKDGSSVTTAWRAEWLADAHVEVAGTLVLLTLDTDDSADELLVYDAMTGTTTVLMPVPTDTGEEYGLGGIVWWSGVTSSVAGSVR